MKKSTALTAFGEALCALPIGRHPGLRISTNDGYKGYCFGAATGRWLNLQSVCHEMGHAVQFGPDAFDARVKPQGYGFRFPVREVEIGGRFYESPMTGQCTAREVETLAIQQHIHEALGRRYPRDRVLMAHIRSFDVLKDWIHYGGGGDNRRRHRRLAALATRFYEQWTKPEIFDRLEGWLDKTQERLRMEGEPTFGMFKVGYWTPITGSLPRGTTLR